MSGEAHRGEERGRGGEEMGRRGGGERGDEMVERGRREGGERKER